MTADSKKIGQQLVSEGLISPAALDAALTEQQQTGGFLGAILTAARAVSPLHLYHALARQQQAEMVNLIDTPPNASLLHSSQANDYIRLQAVPWQTDNDCLWIACAEINEQVREWAQTLPYQNMAFVLATPRDIHHALTHYFGEEIDRHARNNLSDNMPIYSARQRLNSSQLRSLLILILILAGAFIFFPQISAIILLCLINFFYIATIGLKYLLYIARKKSTSGTRPPLPADAQLPIYTVLIPLFREQDSIPRLLNAIRALDYPKSKLDVKLVVETDDEMTIEAIKTQRPEPYFEIIRVPYSEPRTKPKACDYALAFARGEYITIYDAEDQPEPLQLKKAVAAFRALPEKVVCLQARLNYYNWNENLLTRLFSIEYASLFDFMLPGLQALSIPIPLGGTSNHFKLARIREVGEWDPYNVTEDADLGMRLALRGYETRMLDSITLEESPLTLKAWLHQRARWIKGYMQTWLVYMRQPMALYRQTGATGFWGFQFFIGGPCLVFLLAPILWLLSITWWLGWYSATLPGWLIVLCYLNLLTGILVHVWLARVATIFWQWNGMGKAIAAYPFYWLLHSLAGYRALWQLIRQPHHWNKTEHGLTKIKGLA